MLTCALAPGALQRPYCTVTGIATVPWEDSDVAQPGSGSSGTQAHPPVSPPFPTWTQNPAHPNCASHHFQPGAEDLCASPRCPRGSLQLLPSAPRVRVLEGGDP